MKYQKRTVGRPMTKKEEEQFFKRRVQMVMERDSIIQSSGSDCTPTELSNAIIDGVWLAIDHGAYEAFDENGDGSIAFRKPLKLEKMDRDERERFQETIDMIRR